MLLEQHIYYKNIKLTVNADTCMAGSKLPPATDIYNWTFLI